MAMTAEGRRRNARRLLHAIERRGGQWILVNWDKFALAHFWLPSRTRRRLKRVQAEALLILQNATIQEAERAKLAALPKQEEQSQVSVN